MRILVVTTWYPSDAAPESGIFVQRDVQLLAREHEVVVLHLVAPRVQSFPSTETADGVTIRRFPMSTSNPVQILRASRLLAQQIEGFDALHTMALSSLLPLAPIRVRVPWLHTEHWSGIVAPETAPTAMRLTLPATTRLLARPDVVIAVSGYLADHIRERRSGPIRVIPNFVMTPASIAERPLSSGTLRLVAVGGLIARKGPDVAIAAVRELRNRGVRAHLTWIGDGPMRAELEETVRRDELESSVTFAGVQPPDAVALALAESDLFILPTSNETFGVSIAEALASGRSVVVGATGGQSEFVTPNNGERVSDRTGAGFADAIERAVSADRHRAPEEIAGTVRELFSETNREMLYSAAYRQAGAGAADNSPDVDVIIAVHDTARPIRRAVASVLDHTESRVRVSVACHNLPVESISALLTEYASDDRLRFLSVTDGTKSPAGPFNAGLEAASARFTSVMGSDDELEPGAVDSWLDRARADRADVVISRLRFAGGGFVPTPPTRGGRTRRLDGVRDRLSYRSAPLGLVSRERFGNLRFPNGPVTGEDVSYVSELWFSGARISYDMHGPSYLIHEDARERASLGVRPIADDLAFLVQILDAPPVSLTRPAIAALATKLWRIHVFGAIYKRRDVAWTPSDRAELAHVGRRLQEFSPEALRPLAIADRALVDAAMDPSTPDSLLVALSLARRRRIHPHSVLTRDLRSIAHREAPIRMGFATVLQLRTRVILPVRGAPIRGVPAHRAALR